MGFFSKLFGAANEQIARNIANEVLKNTQNTSQNNYYDNSQPSSKQKTTNEGASGFSWGPVMPSEENQYNYNGTFSQYFDSIFLREFSCYEIMKNEGKYTHLPYYSFIKNGRCVLMVELFSRRSAANKLRNDCRNAGIPYLRYYIDVDGWWNTKEYVIKRTRDALGKH